MAKLGVHAIDVAEEDILGGDLSNVLTFDQNTARKLFKQDGDDHGLDMKHTFLSV